MIADNTPVIVGVGFSQYRSDDPLACPEPSTLMIEAVRNAAADAQPRTGASELLAGFDSISVLQGMWQYRNPGKLIADAIGNSGAKSVLADLGVLQLTPLFDLLQAIARGEQSLGVVTAGEAKYRELRAKIAGVEIRNTVQPDDTPAPDIYHPTPDPFATEVEGKAGLMMPVELFSVIESSLRHAQGLDIETHRDRIAQLYSEFSAVAASNPHAWQQQALSAAEIRNPSAKNSMLAFPYTKSHNSQWNVNQSVAIIACSAAKARELGIDESRWIFPLAGAQSRHVVCLAEKKQLHSHPGAIVAGERAYALAGITPAHINVADLYSCFPCAVQAFARDLRLSPDIPWCISGSMAFGGGPFNHGALNGAARMVEVLRGAREGKAKSSFGLTSNLSGVFGKQAVIILGTAANERGFGFADVTAEVAAIDPPLVSTSDYLGPATVVGYTVVYKKEGLSHGFVYCDTPDGRRTVGRSQDNALLQQMTEQEFVGRTVTIGANLVFTAAN